MRKLQLREAEGEQLLSGRAALEPLVKATSPSARVGTRGRDTEAGPGPRCQEE